MEAEGPGRSTWMGLKKEEGTWQKKAVHRKGKISSHRPLSWGEEEKEEVITLELWHSITRSEHEL